MDIDYLLRSFHVPYDRPLWEASLLARLGAEPAGGAPDRSVGRAPAEPERTAVILNFKRQSAA